MKVQICVSISNVFFKATTHNEQLTAFTCLTYIFYILSQKWIYQYVSRFLQSEENKLCNNKNAQYFAKLS